MKSRINLNQHHGLTQRALELGRSNDPLSGHAVRPDFYLPELDVSVENSRMDTADFKFGMLKKQHLYQQEGKGLIAIHPTDKPRLDTLLRHRPEIT